MNVPSENCPPRSRGRPRVDDKRRRVLDAALRVFAERGYHGTAVPEIAAAAKVGTGTLYRYFATKEALVNEVYRDAKARLGSALLDGLDLESPGDTWFLEVWGRLARFARAEPDAFRFLEMQDHAPYLDGESRRVELSVLGPLWLAGQRIRDRRPEAPLPVDVVIALVWGAFVGLIKAERLGYLRLDDATLAAAGKACWEIVLPPDGAPPNSHSAPPSARPGHGVRAKNADPVPPPARNRPPSKPESEPTHRSKRRNGHARNSH